MEDNSAAVESMILFYIENKQLLKTKQLLERRFLDEMRNFCNWDGFSDYSNEETIRTWRRLVTRYLYLKANGTVEKRNAWKFFKILDSCYEPSDFHNSERDKFSVEMVWFLIECFLKRKTLIRTQKRNTMFREVYKEFLRAGYIHITETALKNKWLRLISTYNQLRDNPEDAENFPYLSALKAFNEDGVHVVDKMVFTQELTEILIERFTEKKAKCVVLGYDCDQVLGEIQSEFRDLGFHFSKDYIRNKWNQLTNIYRFLKAKGKEESAWVYFAPMKNHFQDDFLPPWTENDKLPSPVDTSKLDKRTINITPRCLRQRSKSMGTELRKKASPPTKLTRSERMAIREEKKSGLKRPLEDDKRLDNQKRVRGRAKSMDRQVRVASKEASALKVLPVDANQETRKSGDVGAATSKVHIINIAHSDIDQTSGNLTINLPSITKQFSDNECLPLKKRLWVEGENNFPDSNQEIGFVKANSSQANESKRLTEEEMARIIERINKENSSNPNAVDRSHHETPFRNFSLEDFHNPQSMYSNFDLLVPKKEPRQEYGNSDAVQPPVFLLVIKVDGANNPVKIDNSRGSNDKTLQDNSSEGVRKQAPTPPQSVSSSNCTETTPRRESTTSGLVTSSSSCAQEVKAGTSAEELEPIVDNISDICAVGENVTVYTTPDGNQTAEVTNRVNEETVFRAPLAPHKKRVPVTAQMLAKDKIRLPVIPVKGGGKLKEIFISPRELNKIAKLRQQNVKIGNNLLKAVSSANAPTAQTLPEFKFTSQIIKPAGTSSSNKLIFKVNDVLDDNTEVCPQSSTVNSKCVVNNSASSTNAKSDDCDNESVASEAVVDDGLKDNLLATVIDFQEQNNQEFIEIKNLMKQNNLLQRETNRLLRLMLEK